MIGKLPTLVTTVILPFDGLLTYGTCALTMPVVIGPHIQQSMAGELSKAREQGNVVTTARQFAQVAPVARTIELAHAAEQFAHQTELEMNAHELAEDQHVGALAGLSWEEREKAIMDHVHQDDQFGSTRDLALSIVDSWCTPGRPVHTMEEAITKLDRKQLMEAARRFGVTGAISKMSKKRLVSEVMKVAPQDADAFLGSAILCGEHCLSDLRRVYDAGGRVDVPVSSVKIARDVPQPSFPATLLYKVDDAYSCVMPDEVRAALTQVDWDEEQRRAHSLDQAVGFLDLMVDFRGVVPLIEAMQECMANVKPAPDWHELLYAIRAHIDDEKTCFDIVNADEDAYLVHFGIADYDQEVDEEHVNDVLDAQVGKEPRPIADAFATCRFVSDWVLERPAARELTAYFDAHVPDGCDDYYFADCVVEDVLFIARDRVDISEVLNTINEDGFMPTEAQLNHLLMLLSNFVNDIPNWSNNGWTPNELHEQAGK